MNAQEILLKTIRSLIAKDISLNEEIAKILDISYDAAHRRISLKSKFSIEETVQLCLYFEISMDAIFQQKKQLIVQKTKPIVTLHDFKDYFDKTNQIALTLQAKETTVYYAAKDIPMNYAVSGTVFSKFKFYIWFTLLNKNQTSSFENFKFEDTFSMDNSVLKTFFEETKRIEIWNDTTINSTLQQVNYFFEAGLVTYKNAIQILEDLADIIKKIETNCESNTSKFQLYYNELLILNNAALFYSEEKAAFFLPYNALGYYVTTDKQMCLEQFEYITNQLYNSKSLNQSGKKDRNIFFQKMHQKIEYYKNKIRLDVEE